MDIMTLKPSVIRLVLKCIDMCFVCMSADFLSFITKAFRYCGDTRLHDAEI